MSFMRKALSRRTLLRGSGAAFSLPLLDAMVPANTAIAATVANPAKLRRVGYVYIPMGYSPRPWIPEGESLDKLPFTLEPLEKVKSKVTVVSGMELKNAYPGSHATSNAAYARSYRFADLGCRWCRRQHAWRSTYQVRQTHATIQSPFDHSEQSRRTTRSLFGQQWQSG